MRLTAIEPQHFDQVLDLNLANVELLAPMDRDRLELLLGWADRALVISHHEAFVGFVITVRAGTTYDSVNYRWFSDHYDDFYYLDRVVLAPELRRLGLGSQVYDVLEARAREVAPRMCLEVNADPPNVPSLRFHAGRGFDEVARLGEAGHVNSLRMLEW